MNFGDFVARRHRAGELVVQPRMGFSDVARMRGGLLATKDADATTVGTLTLDSYTRLGNLDYVTQALERGIALNGFPLVHTDSATAHALLDGVLDDGFPIQVRHGSARPADIVRAMVRVGLHATEGGPISYCLPYGRTPLDEAVRNWSECCELIQEARGHGFEPHLESFGGCMMGQLCPPSMLVAISVIEAMFFAERGLRSISVSYAQQVDPEQDREAVAALRRLCRELLPDVEWHVVIYAYMGLFPRSREGAFGLLGGAAQLAVETGAERLIVKTAVESQRVPTIGENIAALEYAAAVARAARRACPGWQADVQTGAQVGGQVYEEARVLVEAVRNAGPDLAAGIVTAFKRGLLDVPYCLHPDNANRSRGYIDGDGRLAWAAVGDMPLPAELGRAGSRRVGSSELMSSLSYLRDRFDAQALEFEPFPALGAGAEH